MNAALATRLRFIDFLLETYGYINRAAVMDYFGLSVAQVSLDFREYLKAAPENVQFDKSGRRYVKTPSFKRKFP